MRTGLRILLLLVATAAIGIAISLSGRSPATALDTQQNTITNPADCTLIVDPDTSPSSTVFNTIQDAIDAAAANDVICVRNGTYVEVVRVDVDDLMLVPYPGDSPIIDGNKRLPGNEFGNLVQISSRNVLFEGFDVRQSTGRGVTIVLPAENVTLRNLDVHDNWHSGILAKGASITDPNGALIGVDYIKDLLVEDSRVYRNVRKAQYAPVIYQGTSTGGADGDGNPANDFEFNPDNTWDTPFWDGTFTDMPEIWVDGISVLFNGPNVSRVYVNSASSATDTILSGHTANGQNLDYAGDDIMFHDPATDKWTHYFNGQQLGLPWVTNNRAIIDAFYVESTPTCAGCYPILMSFGSSITMDIGGVQTSIGPSDIVRFEPSASTDGRLTAGAFSVETRATDIGLSGSDNIDALGWTPDGRLIAGTSGNFPLGGVSKDDLAVYDDQTGSWSLYFDASDIDYYPFPSGATAMWVDEQGNVYISGNVSGGSGLVFIETQDGVAQGNEVYFNWGETLVAGRNSDRITFSDNVAYDNLHANMSTNSVTNVLFQRNFLYCTADHTYWRRGGTTNYRPGPGLVIRDENFEILVPQKSRYLTIVNNIVVGCAPNFNVSTQDLDGPGGGLIDSVVASNAFINARGDTAVGVNNVQFNYGNNTAFIDSYFINNLIRQATPGNITRENMSTNQMQNFVIANNLYSPGALSGWFPAGDPVAETGRVEVPLDDPLLINPVTPGAGATPDPNWYALDPAAAAHNAGLLTPAVTEDFLTRPRAGLPDIGPFELLSRIHLVKETSPASAELFDFVADYVSGVFQVGSNQPHDSGYLDSGTYAVTEQAAAGWQLTGATCDDGSTPDAIDLGPGEEVTCTFENSEAQQQATLVVHKETLPDGDPQLFSFIPDYGAPFDLSDGQQQSDNLAPGTYAVTETTPGGWQPSTVICDDGSQPDAVQLAAGETVTCIFTSSKNGTLIIAKETLPDGDPQLFSFTTNYGDPFDLVDGQNQQSELAPGVYTVSESTPSGWQPSTVECSDGSQPTDIDLDPGETVTCTFTSTKDGSAIVILKETLPDGDLQTFTFTTSYGDPFDLTDGGSRTDPLAPGVYSVSEATPSGWQDSDVVCSDGSEPGAIGLEAGETVTCTFTSSKNGAIAIRKETLPDGDPQNFTFTTSYGAPFDLADGAEQSTELAPGSYSVSEATPPGWQPSAVVCSDGSIADAISVGPGETVTCTFTSSRSSGIVIQKETLPDGDPQSFSFAPSFGPTFSLSDGQSYSEDLEPGTYTVIETTPAGWLASAVVCSDGSPPNAIDVGEGELVTCTYTSEKLAQLVVAKETIPAGHAQAFGFTSSYSSPFALAHGQTHSRDLAPDTGYSISENTPLPTGWSLTSAVCDDGSPIDNIDLSPGEVVTCTFRNSLAGDEPEILLVNPVADAYVYSPKPNNNYGSQSVLRVRDGSSDFNSYLMFDLQDLGCADVQSATVRLYVTDIGPDAGSIYAVHSNWTEGGITWNNAPPLTGSPLDGGHSASLNEWVEFDVNGAVTAGSLNSFGVKGMSSNVVYFSSRQGSNPPQLQVEYLSAAGGAPTAAFSAAPLSGPADLTVSFQDESTGCPTGWSWDFGDGHTADERNPSHTYQSPGNYTVTLNVSNAAGDDSEVKTSYVSVQVPPPSDYYYLTTTGNGNINGLSFAPADILRYDMASDEWDMYYDGSDVSTTKSLNGFSLQPDGSILLAWIANQPVGGVGTFAPQDIARFEPSQTGESTDGDFSWFFDGSDVGLTTSGERIDALGMTADGRLLISTMGNAVVPAPGGGTLKVQDEDILAFEFEGSPGEITEGDWSIYFDATAIPGMGAEDINGFWEDPDTGERYITILGAFAIGDTAFGRVSGNGRDIIKLTPNAAATGGWVPTLHWDGSAFGFPRNLGGVERD